MRFTYTYRSSDGRRHGLRPRRRPVDRAAVGKRHHFRQLAARRQVAGDGLAIGGVVLKVGCPFVWIKNDNLTAELITEKVKRCNEIRVTADYCERFGKVAIGILEKFGDKIHVGAFLFHLHHMHITIGSRTAVATLGVHGRNPRLVLVVVAFDDFYVSICLNGSKINVLSLNCGAVMWIGLHARGKILDADKIMLFRQETANESGKVEPLIAGTSAQETVVEISSVNVGYCLHRLTVKKKRSQTLRPKTSLRVGRTVRLDMNLLTGSVGSVPNRQMVRKGVCGVCGRK